MTPRTKPSSCAGCVLHSHGTDFSQPEGTGALRVALIGEASGENEARDQLPFRPYARGGQILERTLRRLGLNRQQFVISNCLRCRPRNNLLEGMPYEMAAISQCAGNLSEVISRFRPKVIVPLGNIPLRTVTGLAGPDRGIGSLRGYVLPTLHDGILALPSYHPAFIGRGAQHLMGVLARDILRAIAVAQGKDSSYILNPQGEHKGYIPHPTAEQARALRGILERNTELPISFDLETYESTSLEEDQRTGFTDTEIRLIQFSYKPGYGMAMPWKEPFKSIAAAILALPNPKLGHNCFAQSTSVWMANGTWKPITKVQPGDYIRSLKNGCIAKVKVENQFKTIDERSWVEVKVDGAYNRGVGKWGNPGVICTPDHEWFLANGAKVEAARLIPGDCVITPRAGAYDLICGTLNGDASVNSQGTLQCNHTNQAWAQAKARAFETEAHEYKFRSAYHEGEKLGWYVRTRVSKHWHAAHYDGTQKIFVKGSDRMLAVFYGDDGWLASKKKKNQTARLALHGFRKETHSEIINWFTAEFGPCSIQNEAVLALSVRASREFFSRIAQYLHSSMDYKLPAEFKGKYNGWMSVPEPQYGWVESVVPAHPKQYNAHHKYCLIVEDTHSFFTRSGLVSNCNHFDLKVLKVVGGREGNERKYWPKGPLYDTLDLFRTWQPDLPANLQFAASFANFPFPWKHLSESDLEFYGCADVDAALRLAGAGQRAMRRFTHPLSGLTLWDGYERSVYAVRPVLRDMEDRGLPVDDVERMRLGGEFDKEESRLRYELDLRCPDEVKSVHPKEGYKKTPKDTSEMVQREFTVPSLDADGNPSSSVFLRWCKIEPFSHNSSQQLIRYMRAKGHPVPKDAKKISGETTAAKELTRLADKTGDDFYLKVIECREFGKMKGTYIDGYAPGIDKRVHTSFTFDTATLQLAAKHPNVVNIPKHGRLAASIRRMFKAPQGYEFSEWDFKSYHVLTTGFNAESAQYMRLARLDMHSFVANEFLRAQGQKGLENADRLFVMPDEELAAYLKWFKGDKGRKIVRDGPAKQAGLSVGFGMGDKTLFLRYREYFSSLAEAVKVKNVIRGMFPEVFEWQDRVRQLAHQQTYLQSRFGNIRWFYEVFVWDNKRGKWVSGEQSEQAIAFLPATEAFGNIRECFKELDRTELAEKYGLCNTVHDSCVFMYPSRLREEHLAEVYPVLTAPSKILVHDKLAPQGLSVGVECACGPNLAEMEEVSLSAFATA